VQFTAACELHRTERRKLLKRRTDAGELGFKEQLIEACIVSRDRDRAANDIYEMPSDVREGWCMSNVLSRHLMNASRPDVAARIYQRHKFALDSTIRRHENSRDLDDAIVSEGEKTRGLEIDYCDRAGDIKVCHGTALHHKEFDAELRYGRWA